ncbi:MAG: hypothetical protein V2I51_05295 [Anderseniella sp.]|jgi:hypothetical protein|nr:hypothetical protein [Anderseniella sp.]
MAPELGVAVIADMNLTEQAIIGIAIGAVVFLLGKHLVKTLVRAMWLVAALAMGQVVVTNNQTFSTVLEAGKSAFPGFNNEQLICELYTKNENASDLLCGSGLKGTIH